MHRLFQTVYILLFIGFLSPLAHGQVDSTYYKLNQQLSEARKEKNFIKLGKAYYLLGLYEEKNFTKADNSFEYFTNAKQYFDVNQDTLMSKTVDLAIANRYQKSGLYQEAIDLYDECIKYFSQNDRDTIHLAKVYYDLSHVYHEKGDVEKRMECLNKAEKLNAKAPYPYLKYDILLERIKSYESLNEIDSAIYIVNSIIEESLAADYLGGVSQGYYEMARLEKTRSNYSKALAAAKKSKDYLIYTPYDTHRRNLLRLLADLYNYTNNHSQAYFYENQYSVLNDSILTKEKIQSSNNLTLKYQLNEKNSDIKLLEIEKNYAENRNNQQRRMLYLLSAGLFLLLLLIYFIVNFYRQKMKSEDIIRQQDEKINVQRLKELEDQYQINNLQSMIEGQEIERERIARDLHDSLGGLLSAVKLQFDSVQTKNEEIGELKEYTTANKMLDLAVEEVRSISQNLQPGSLSRMGLIPALRDLFNRFDGDTYPDVDFQTYDVPEKIDNMIALSIYRIIQELYYNTIKHAQATEVLLQINRDGDELIIQFEDDGIGYDPENLKRKGMGLENIRSRIQYLKGDMEVDAMPDEGTSVLLNLRYK